MKGSFVKELTIDEIQQIQLSVMVKFHEFCEKNKLTYYLIGGGILGSIRHKGFIPWDDDLDVGMPREDYEKMLCCIDSFFPSDLFFVSNYRRDKKCDHTLTRLYILNTFVDSENICKHDRKEMYFDIFPLDYLTDDENNNNLLSKKYSKIKKELFYSSFHFTKPNSFVAFMKNLYTAPYKLFRRHIIMQGIKIITKYISNKEKGAFLCSISSQYPLCRQKMPIDVYGKPTLYAFKNYYFFGPEKVHDYLSTLFGNDYMSIPPEEKRRKHHRTLLLK